MLFTRTTFIGLDPTAGKRPFIYAALDHQRRLLALATGDMEEVLAFVGGQQEAYVAVSAPFQPNQGLMDDETRRAQLAAPPRAGRYLDYRLVEYLLCVHNIRTYRTPALISDCPRWMQIGFTVYQRLQQLGFQRHPAGENPRQFLEVYPHASYCGWLDRAPQVKGTLEGRLQRQLSLYEHGLPVPDPMFYFDEISRSRLLQGRMPADILYEPGELDALAAAYTAWLAAHQPDQISLIGDPDEGQIVLPVPKLKKIKG